MRSVIKVLVVLMGVCLPASVQAAGGGPVAVSPAPMVLDGQLDAPYVLIVEDTFAAPDVGVSGQTASSDLIGESSANLVWFGFGNANYLGYDDGAGLFIRGSGSADIHNLYVTWDATWVYLAVEGPNAYHETIGTGDDMDLFIAVDTLQSAVDPTTPVLDASAVPGNKAVDFAGWAPNYFIVVRSIGPTSHDARLYQGLTEVATDLDQLDGGGDFEVDGQHASAVTEIRVAWSLLGGAPSQIAGAPWSMAVYTTYSGDSYDVYDSAPGYGQSSHFEEVGDTACDSDHCAVSNGGDGSLDPVTGAFDACDCASEDDRLLGAGLAPTGTESPGSDNTAVVLGGIKDVDTLQGYFLVTNVGQLPDGDGDGVWDGADGCPDDPNKSTPGLCGCGVADTDTDGDTTPDCDDGCPDDPDKTEPGTCGCGVADTDTDGDTTPDCDDGCPDDPDKTEPGVCGCGNAETTVDSDGDGTVDCIDTCVDDPDKIEPGVCGCGVAEATPCDDDGSATAKDDACNCSAGADPTQSLPWLLALLLTLAWSLRRRRAG